MEGRTEAPEGSGNRKKALYPPNLALKRERELRGWSQAVLAEKIGAQPLQVTRWEKGAAFPGPYYREKLCLLFERNADELALVKDSVCNDADKQESPPDLSQSGEQTEAVPTQETFPGSLLAPTEPSDTPPSARVHSRRLALAFMGSVGVVAGVGGFLWLGREQTSPPAMQAPSRPRPSLYPTYIYHTPSKTYVNTVFWSPDGRSLVCANGDKTATILAATDGKVQCTYRGHQSFVNYAVWSPDSRFVASASSDTSVHIWDAQTGTTQKIYRGHHSFVTCVCWSPTGTFLVSGEHSGDIHVWDALTATRTALYTGHKKEVIGLACSPDAKMMVSCGSDSTVQVWQTRTGTKSSTFIYRGSRKTINYEVGWSPDGRKILSTDENGRVSLWHATSGALIITYTGHTGTIFTARWSPDGRFIASGGEDQTVQIWNSVTGKLLLTYRGHTGPVTELAWSPDGKFLASASNDFTMHVCRVILM